MGKPSIKDKSFQDILEWNKKQKGREDSRVVCAANRNRISGQVILGVRHWDTSMHLAIGDTFEHDNWKTCETGFIDQFSNFLTREEAFVIASKQNQIIHLCGTEHTGKLYSENLY